MNQDREKTTAISARIPDSWLEVLDALARKYELKSGARYSRTDILRMAVARYIGAVEPTPEGDDHVPGATS